MERLAGILQGSPTVAPPTPSAASGRSLPGTQPGPVPRSPPGAGSAAVIGRLGRGLCRLIDGRLGRFFSLPLATALVAGLASTLLLVQLGHTVKRAAPSPAVSPRPVTPPAPVGSQVPMEIAIAIDDLFDALPPGPDGGPEPAAGPLHQARASILPEVPPAPPGLDDVARELQRRRAELLELEATLALREAAVRAAEADLARQVDRLDRYRQSLEALVDKAEAEEEERLQQLVRMYESMRAKSAAAIFDRLELPVILAVAKRMREARMAAILAAMDPGRARVVTSELAKERELPRLD